MKRFVFLVLVVLTMILLWWTVRLYINKNPQEHTVTQTFEEIESLRK